MPYQRRGEAAEPTPPHNDPDDVDQSDDAPPAPAPAPQVTKARRTLWVVGLLLGGYMIVSGIVQYFLNNQP